MYQVIGTAKSRAFRVLWMMEELGADYEHVPAVPRSEGVTQVNPAGKVPVLVDDGTPITDSTAILAYLADRHGRLTHKAGTLDRARQDSLTQFLLDEFDAALWLAARHSFILPEEMRLSAIKNTLRWEFEASQKTMAHRMADGPFLMGSEMTVPDLILTHCLDWALTARFPITEARLSDYLERMRERPAYRQACAL
ncbi:glutathione S-transferase family protein [Paracoccus sp. 1_MG-2023]|uniref:glutathione S-transferase family protein n=1 Tax=unclassified Paracoccus (in: a-proteobacteria) TaxID=2688777 RepID=UPI001C0A0687|nr:MULTISPECIES: glutathione S-transferase family protein [unclassified Paracoccus (in: a-proteobacteria)]MBU2957382.1 glutathione S-transferase family protein [Paracoccus sp. C2R09]MDO6670144.1 glutathione S-transferase family protein [Paracoccus sp. 1_MG-2023]